MRREKNREEEEREKGERRRRKEKEKREGGEMRRRKEREKREGGKRGRRDEKKNRGEASGRERGRSTPHLHRLLHHLSASTHPSQSKQTNKQTKTEGTTSPWLHPPHVYPSPPSLRSNPAPGPHLLHLPLGV